MTKFKRYLRNAGNTADKSLFLPDVDGLVVKKNILEKQAQTISTAVRDFAIYQKFPFYRWPVWLNYSARESGKTAYNRQVTPYFYLNDTALDCVKFTNFLSDDELVIDSSGLVSPSYSNWSVELWLQKGDDFFRAADNPEQVIIERNTKNSIITIVWDHPLCKIHQSIYGTRSTIDEAIIDVTYSLKTSARDVALLFVIRPYNHRHIGEISKLEYQTDSKLIKIDGLKKIFINDEPNFILTGNTAKGDINNEVEDTISISCRNGLATQALGYSLKKKEGSLHYSIALSHQEMTEGEYNFEKIKQDFIEFVDVRLKKHFNLKFPEKRLQDWFFAAKISALNYHKNDLFPEGNTESIDVKTFFYIIYAYNRMGYLVESGNLIDSIIKRFVYNEKKDKNLQFKEIINCCYYLNAFADYYVHTRNTDWLHSRYSVIKNSAAIILQATSKIKKIQDLKTNSFDHYIIKEAHPFDIVLLSFTCRQFAYLARCMGIFGDEIRYNKESERLAEIFKKAILNQDGDYLANQNMPWYNVLSYMPFNIPLEEDIYKSVLKSIELPVHDISAGWDIFASIMTACNNIIFKEDKALTFIDMLVKMAGKRYTLPEFVNPASQLACFGDGASKLINTMFFITIRNLLFVDSPDRLDLFPIPNENWFAPGKEIKVENAPSRFGTINFRMVATSNEIHLFFEETPKYIPPDIMINLPFKAKIASGDDFILKKHVGNAFVINGWPEIVKFNRN